MIKVGIIFDVSDNWMGGVNYYRNLINAVCSLPDRKIAMVILAGKKLKPQFLDGLPDVEIVQHAMLDFGSFTWRIRRFIIKLTGNDYLLSILLRVNHISLLSHSGWLGKSSNIPTLGWIPDFQHVHLPEFFSPEELQHRDQIFGDICRFCTRVIVSSQDALNDLKEFSPDNQEKAVVLNFASPSLALQEELPSLAILQQKYDFHEDYFLLPNQFWAHKNHQIVIKALAEFLHGDRIPLVLATGNTYDARQPSHYPALMQQIESFQLKDRFRVLGMVPFQDLKALMFYAKAIINPSLFEGWSTTVEEAKALGQTVVLSDIRVHREQNPPNAYFFAPDNAKQLASILNKICTQEITQGKIDARPQANMNYKAFALMYQGIVIDEITRYKG